THGARYRRARREHALDAFGVGGGVHAVVPGVDVQVEVRQMHRAAGGEVPVGPLVGDAAQRLEARDVVRAERLRLGTGEAHHQLGVVRDLPGTGGTRGQGE